jgi:hypothetical protein
MPGWPFDGLLDNATLTATRATSLAIDPESGQEVPGSAETVVFRAYFKSNKGVAADGTGQGFASHEGGGGIDPERTDKMDGFADRILPAWVLSSPTIQCVHDSLGVGTFEPRPQIRSAQALVEAETGSYLYGKFIKGK